MSQNVLARNNVKVFGKGAHPLLFAHGFGCDQNMWRFVTPAFEDDYQIVLLDYVGAGKSDLSAYCPERYSSLEGYAQDILDVCAALALSDVILVGHSVSSVIGMLATIREPARFDRLILVSPSPRYLNDLPKYVGGFEEADIEGLLLMMEKNYMGWAHYLAPVVMGAAQQPDLERELEISFCSTDPVIARRFAAVTFFGDNREDLPKVPVPSLILQCSEDLIAPVEVGRYLNRHLPKSSLRLLQAMGHCPHMSHPEETIQAMKDYLYASIPPASV